ncbi:MAG: hypothetical protein J6F30_12205 [Cellulosilyticum sp.]|nr:hypothetical protein [Cellulosilyticum sp.]
MIHEGVHLVFGLLSGYRFSSFRIAGWMWIKKEGKLCFKKLSYQTGIENQRELMEIVESTATQQRKQA